MSKKIKSKKIKGIEGDDATSYGMLRYYLPDKDTVKVVYMKLTEWYMYMSEKTVGQQKKHLSEKF